jgi:predicted phosphodiesterase
MAKKKQSPFLLTDDPAAVDVKAEIEFAFDEDTEYESLRSAHLRVLRQYEKLKTSKLELREAVYKAAFDAAAALKLNPTPKPANSDKRRKATEVAVPWLSDWQLAKITPSYNSQVCEERVELYAQKVLELTEIQRADHPVKEAHVFITGDLIEGELIFPGQHWLIDSSLYTQVCLDGPRILGNFLRTMLANFDRVHVTAVIGNHGRIGGRGSRDMNAESNGDRMLYRITQQLLADEKRLTWTIPDGDRERHWYAVAGIGNYRALLLHGDQFRGHAGIPWYGIQKKAGGWALGAIEEEFDEIIFGHYHQPTRVTLNSVTARCSGSTESHNTFAVEQLAAVGRPSQNLLFIHPDKGEVTAEYCVWLDDKLKRPS